MARATVVSGTVVRSRTAPTTFSTVSAACTVQSWAPACGMAAHYPARSVRLALAVVAGAAVAALAALILGEYELVGFTPYVAGVAFGRVVAEVITSVARRSGPVASAPSAVRAGGGMGGAAWCASGRDWSSVPGGAWVGVVLAAACGAGWAWRR